MEQTIDYKGCTIRIEQDQDAESPRDWSNLGTMACAHRRYNLGDAQFHSAAALESSIPADAIRLPLYLYDHSGITIATTPFSCPWDSGQVGYIYVSREKARRENNWKVLTAKRVAQVEAILRSEVAAYDAYLQGNAYGYRAEGPDGESIGSCWGFLVVGPDDETYMLDQAKGEIGVWLATRAEQAEQTLALL